MAWFASLRTWDRFLCNARDDRDVLRPPARDAVRARCFVAPACGLNSLTRQAWLFANVRADPEPNGPLTRPPLFDLLAKRQRQGLEL
jgi:hypothetical protein